MGERGLFCLANLLELDSTDKNDTRGVDVTCWLRRHLVRRVRDVYAERLGEGTWYYPAEAAEVRDVCGAGDTVLAMLGVAIASGATLCEACFLAGITAKQQVKSLGVAPMGHARIVA